MKNIIFFIFFFFILLGTCARRYVETQMLIYGQLTLVKCIVFISGHMKY